MAAKKLSVGSGRTTSAAWIVVGLAACITASAEAAVISGIMNEVALNDDLFNAGVFGDGTNSVQFIAGFGWWSEPLASGGMWFYGSEFNYDDASLVRSEVAFVPDVLDVSLITDASAYTYTTNNLANTVAVAGGPQLFGSLSGLVLLRNEVTGHYGALRLDGMRAQPFAFDADSIDVTWWFQTDGTGDFSSVPAPGAAAVFGLAALASTHRRRRALG